MLIYHSCLSATRIHAINVGHGEGMRVFHVPFGVLESVSAFSRISTPQVAPSNLSISQSPNTQAEESTSNQGNSNQGNSNAATTQSRTALLVLKDEVAKKRKDDALADMSMPNANSEHPNKKSQASYIIPSPDDALLKVMDPAAFAIFLAWAMSGQIDQDMIDEVSIHSMVNMKLPAVKLSLETLWFLGDKLGAPGFQNRIMHLIRTSSRTKEGNWPAPREARYIQEQRDATKPCKLYDQAVLCIAFNEPIKRHAKGTPGHRLWAGLLNGASKDMMIEALSMDTSRFANVKPWHKNYTKEWLVKERMLPER